MENSNTSEHLFDEFPPVPLTDWEEQIRTDLKGADFEKKLIWNTYEGIPLRPFYTKEDLQLLGHLESLPGQFPFVRGNKLNDNEWEIRQVLEGDDPKILNRLGKEAINRGCTGLSVSGAKITENEHLEALLEGWDLKRTAIHFRSSRHYPTLLSLLEHYLDYIGLDLSEFQGSLNYDPLGYLLLKGDFYRSREKDLEEAVYLLKQANLELKSLRVVHVNAEHFHNAGANIVQEIAFTLAAANEYLAELTDRGLTADEIAPHLHFSLAIGSNYFLEIAKIRAIRMLWSNIVMQYKPSDALVGKAFLHSVTSLWNMSIFDPYVNLLRSTTEAMSAAIAGSDAITVKAFDQAYKDSDEFSSRIARNQQIILKEEAWLDKVIDPSAGSYYIEMLTDQLSQQSWKLFQQVEEKGGFLACLKEGYIQEEIRKTASQKISDAAIRKLIILGTNQYPNAGESMSGQINKIKAPEMSKETPYQPLDTFRISASFEGIRLATERFATKTGKKPGVFLFAFGDQSMRKARASFSSNFFSCAGFEITDHPGFESISAGLEAVSAEKPNIVVLCSADEEYPQAVPEICAALKKDSPSIMIVVAGYPKEYIEPLTSAGVDAFIHLRSNLIQTLSEIQNKLGI